MDPFKILNMTPVELKHPSDLKPARKKARTLWKRFSKEKNKFDAKKVLEAFDMLKQRLKNKPGEGSYKILGRSRMERMMDKHYNHQTKEIKNNKQLMKALRRARKGEKRLLLPGEKERVPRHRRESRRARYRRKRAKMLKRAGVDVLQGLQRLTGVLRERTKFPKAIKLLHRWMKEHMNKDNREFVFEVLQEIVDADFLTDDSDARRDVVAVFDYLFGQYAAWFDESDRNKAFRKYWRLSTVLSCQCYTDDAFVLAATIGKLNEAFAFLEEHKDSLGDFDNAEVPGASPDVSGGPCKSPSDFSDDEDVKDELKDEDVKEEVKDEVKEEVKQEVVVKNGIKQAPPVDSVVKPETKPSKRGVKRQASVSIDLDLDDDGPIDLDDATPEEGIEIDTDDDDDDDGWCSEISSVASESSVCISDEELDEIELDDSIFPMPTIARSVEQLRRHFVSRCMAALFQQRGPSWAKVKIDPFFQEIFYKRSLLTAEQRIRVEGWQARIKSLQQLGERDVGEANNPLEAHRPVVDSREMRVSLDSDANSWANKQTFDARDTFGGSKTMR